MVTSKLEQKTIAVSYYIEIDEEYYIELIKENKNPSSIIRSAIGLQFQKSGMIKEFDEMNKHNWFFKNIEAQGKLIYRVSYFVETEEHINY